MNLGVGQVQTWDPRAVLLSMLLLVLGIKGLDDLRLLLLAELGLLVGVGLSGVSLAAFLRRSVWVLPFCSAALPLVLTTPGNPVATLGTTEWMVTEQGVEKVALIVGQTVLCFQILLLGGTLQTSRDLLWGLQALGCPARLVVIMGLCLRYLNLLAEDLQRLQRAMSCRGAADLGWLARLRMTGGLLGSLFVRALDRAERVQVAMLCRGYSGSLVSGLQPQPTQAWSASDTALIALSLVLAGGIWFS